MALGANVNQVVRLVMLQSVRLAVVGVAIGLAGALAFSRTMQSVLFGVNPADPLVMLAVVVLLLGTTVAASLFPARRAARVDPSEAMRAG
jgi:ABC-type antimicrobial peptide transport system permease subunit